MFLSHVTSLFLAHTGHVLAILFLSADHFDASGTFRRTGSTTVLFYLSSGGPVRRTGIRTLNLRRVSSISSLTFRIGEGR